MRINKYISSHGVASRRAADRLIEEGKVTINGKRAKLGDTIESDDDVVIVDGKAVNPDTDQIYIAYHKPRGVEVTMNRDVKHNIAEAIGLKGHVFPVGRLDKDSSGLLLLTNDGDIVNAILRPASGHEKEYLVHADRPISNEFLRQLANGAKIMGRQTSPTKTTRQNKTSFKIILTEGRNRQIRRMVDKLGFHVKNLKRTRIMNIKLGHLKAGHWRHLTKDELKELKNQL
ncbi:rRNA pseudouridine synthase [Candidatus Uhrbacteria bacterium]|jgi:23S rRNA pseudouridine2604 synthase|nr:rRNA pseudouridine synthase [Candidatus Uhrbacteria bacterium]